MKNKKKNQMNKQPKSVDMEALKKRLPEKQSRSHNVIIRARGIQKSFLVGRQKLKVLKDIDLTFYSGEFAIVYGPSGCGKSTLLHTLIGLEKPNRGKVEVRGKNFYKMDSSGRADWRRRKMGMVFQKPDWIKALSVWENVAYPLYLSGYKLDEAKRRAMEVLAEVEMQDWAGHVPAELSGGQQQRVALARAIVTDPWIVVADEPTGNLDTKSSEELMKYMAELNREKNRMILMVTHDVAFLPIANRRVAMQDGRIVGDEHD